MSLNKIIKKNNFKKNREIIKKNGDKKKEIKQICNTAFFLAPTASLVHLFFELMKHGVFSHEMYMCSLISRGELLSATTVVASASTAASANSSSAHHLSSPPASSGGFQSMHDLRSEMDDSKIDDDLDKLLQHIKEEQQIVMVIYSFLLFVNCV